MRVDDFFDRKLMARRNGRRLGGGRIGGTRDNVLNRNIGGSEETTETMRVIRYLATPLLQQTQQKA